MLIESIVRKTLGIKDHRVVKVEDHEGLLVIDLDVKRRRKLVYSHCGERAKVRDRLKERRWRHVPLRGSYSPLPVCKGPVPLLWDRR